MSRLKAAVGAGNGLIPYLTASDPSDEGFLQAACGAVQGGARAIEIGVPHSDPIADGPVIQRAHQRALKAGGGIQRTLELIAGLRRHSDIPIILFTYINPLLSFGFERLMPAAKAAQIDGILILDLPPQEMPDWYSFVASQGIDPIVLLSPNTSEERLAYLLKFGRGFIYMVAREGITGTHDGAKVDLDARVKRARNISGLPIAVGFGVREAQDVRRIWEVAEAAVVGSALIQEIEKHGDGRIFQAARTFVETLVGNSRPEKPMVEIDK